MPNPLIEIALRRQRPGSGSRLVGPGPIAFDMNLRAMISVPFAIIGGQATKAYMPPRSTLDWDVLVHRDDLDQAQADLQQGHAHTFASLTIPGFTCVLGGGELLDVIAGEAEWVADALAHPNHDETGQPLLALPWLILLKLQAARVQDLADVSRMLAWAKAADLDLARSAIGNFLPDASADFESLLELGRLERKGK